MKSKQIQPKTCPHGGKYYSKVKPKKVKQYSYEDLKSLQSRSLDEKIIWSHAVIKKAWGKKCRWSTAFSAGKDSTVLLHLLLQHQQDIPVIYGNTMIEFPECIQFAKFLRKEWHLNYYEARPAVSFWWVVQEYGWPLMGKTFGVGGVAHKSSRKQFFQELEEHGELDGQYAIQAEVPISSACCTFLKVRPSAKVQKQLGIEGVFLGILAGESRQRMFNFLKYGELYEVKTDHLWKCHPLAIWTDDDVWAYIKRFNVPYAKLYDMGYYNDFGEYIHHKRNGCMFCGMDIKFPDNHLAIMRRTHPKLWEFLMKKKGLGQVLLSLRFAINHHQFDLFTQSIDIDSYLEKFPCAFDRI